MKREDFRIVDVSCSNRKAIPSSDSDFPICFRRALLKNDATNKYYVVDVHDVPRKLPLWKTPICTAYEVNQSFLDQVGSTLNEKLWFQDTGAPIWGAGLPDHSGSLSYDSLLDACDMFIIFLMKR